MAGDAYGRLARLQDAVLEPLNAPLRDIVVRMVAPSGGMRVLDVGCGTGTQLQRYVDAHCEVVGVDTSPAMLDRARARLGERADLRLADAEHLPFEEEHFDIVTATLVLHELAPEARSQVACEMRRVLRDTGRIVLVDFHVGPLRPPKGWAMRAFSVVAESVARHLDRSRAFLAEGGVPALAERLGMDLERTKVVAGGNMAVYVIAPRPVTTQG